MTDFHTHQAALRKSMRVDDKGIWRPVKIEPKESQSTPTYLWWIWLAVLAGIVLFLIRWVAK